MSRFDDIFSRKVKEAFDNYDADHLAGEGWNSFTGKYGSSRKRALLIPLWARAASIIILVTAGVLLMYRFIDRPAGEPGNKLAQQGPVKMVDSIKAGYDTASIQPAINASAATIESGDRLSQATVSQAGQLQQGAVRAGQSGQVGSLAGQSREGASRAGKSQQDASPAGQSQLAGSRAGQSLQGTSLTAQALDTVSQTGRKPESIAEGLHALVAEQAGLVLAESIMPEGISAGVILAVSPVEIRLTGDTDTRLNLPPRKALNDYLVLPREKMTTTLMTGVSGMMASISNATTNAQGVSIGFYVERQLTRRISIRPGLAMAKHNYGMESTPGAGIALGGNMDYYYSAPELNGMTGTTTSFDAVIDVVSMEVPVNFVFSLWKGARSNLFVSTGASTVFYLSQHMSGNFNNTYTRTKVDSNGDVSYESMTTSVKVESEQELLNRVDLLGLANFSAGYSMPFGKGTHLLFEPFVQLPVKDLTSLNLRIRYGGLSMKIQF